MQNKLKSLVSLVLILALGITTLTACTTKQSMDTSPKIAVIRNVSNDDHTQQYLEGAVAEGNMLGFTVDTFVTNGNDNTMQETLQQAINSDYQGLIVSHAKEEYAYQLLKTARDKGCLLYTSITLYTPILFLNHGASSSILAMVITFTWFCTQKSTISLLTRWALALLKLYNCRQYF